MNDRFNNTEEIGINEAHRIITQDFGWIFREKTKRDIGFDAEAETKLDGFIIQIQIKTGLGNFKILKKKNDGLTFYLDSYHYNYWLNVKAPILFLAHIPEQNTTYWQVIKKDVLQKTNKSWKLFIPFSQVFEKVAKEIILDRISIINKPIIFYKPSIEGEDSATIKAGINLGRKKQLDIKQTVDGFKTDDESVNSILSSVLSTAKKYQELSELKRAIYSNPLEFNYRLAISIKYLELDDSNNAAIELTELIRNLIDLMRNGKSEEKEKGLFILAKYIYDNLEDNAEQFLIKLSKIKMVVFVKTHIDGDYTNFINVSMKLLLENNEIELVNYEPNIFIIPEDIPLDIIAKKAITGFKPEFVFNRTPNGISPSLKGFGVTIDIGLMEKELLLDKYHISLI